MACSLPPRACGVSGGFPFSTPESKPERTKTFHNFKIFSFWGVVIHECVCLRIFLAFKNTGRKRGGWFVGLRAFPPPNSLVLLVLVAMFICLLPFGVTLALWLVSSCVLVLSGNWTLGETLSDSKMFARDHAHEPEMVTLPPCLHQSGELSSFVGSGRLLSGILQ